MVYTARSLILPGHKESTMLSKHMLGLMVASCLLTACNDNDEVTQTETVIDTAATQAYTGKTDDASLDAGNSGKFSRAAFAARDYAVSSAGIEHWLTRYSGADVITCADGGKVNVSRDIDITTMLGSKTLTFTNNCTINGISLSGAMTQEVTAYDEEQGKATAVNITYDSLEQTKAGKTVTLTGTLAATQDLAAKTISFDIDTHMKAGSGEEALATLQVAVTGNMADRSASSTYSGKVCLQDDGCVSLTTNTPFKVDYNGYTVAGEMLASGANNTQVKIAAQDDSALVKAALVQ